MFEIANQPLACHLLYLAQWMGGNTFSFSNVNEVGLFLLLRCLYRKQNMELLFLCLTRYVTWDTRLNTWIEIIYPCALMNNYSTFIFLVNCYFTQTYDDEYELLNVEEHKQEFQIQNRTVMWQAALTPMIFRLIFAAVNGFLVSKETVVLHQWESETKSGFDQTIW